MRKIAFVLLIVFLSCKSEDNTLLVKYKNEAFHDIKVDSVKLFGFGLSLPPHDSLEALKNNKRVNIYKKYGLFRKNLGCTTGNKELDHAVKEYHKITDSYLEGRNGKGWKEKMEQELSNIVENGV
jgi:hypothetical protein